MTYNQNKTKTKTKKKVFSFNIDNVIDIITNSSSELFVLEAESETIVKEMIKSVHDNYESEYEQPIKLIDCSIEQMEIYIDCEFNRYKFNADMRKDYSIKGILPKLLYSNWKDKDIAKYWYPELSETGCKLLKKELDPECKIWLLFSIDENPDWEKQKNLMNIATRFHLG